jgi:thiol-disulfide isomerase/thioredoxin
MEPNERRDRTRRRQLLSQMPLVVAVAVLLTLCMDETTLKAAPQARDTVRMEGIIRTEAGRPVEGVRVYRFYMGPEDCPYGSAPKSTDRQGRYRFDVIPGRTYWITAGGLKATSAQSKKYVAQANKPISVADLIVRPFSASVEGCVVLENGRPAANLDHGYVSDSCCPIDAHKPPKTDEDGRFTIEHLLPDESYAFWVFVDDCRFRVWKRLNPNEPTLALTLREEDCVTLPKDWKRYDTHEAIARYAVYAENSRIAFALPTLDGKVVSLPDARFQNKAVVVNITGSWCGGCRLEAPCLARFYDKYKAEGLEVIGVAFEPASRAKPLEAIASMREEFSIPYTLLYGGPTERAHVESVIKGLRDFKGYPTTLYIDRSGQVQFIQTGFWISSEEHKRWQLGLMEEHIRAILAPVEEPH